MKLGALRHPRAELERLRRAPCGSENFLPYLLQRLGVDYIGIYRPARRDPAVPIDRRLTRVGVSASCTRQGAALEIAHGLFDFLPRIHDERAVLHDWLAQRATRQDEEAGTFRSRRCYLDAITA